MLDKLAEVEKRYEELERLMSDPQLLNQQREYSKLAKERAELEEIVTCFREWRKVEQEIQENRQLLEESDEAIRELAKEEVGVLRQRKEELENRLKFLILPKDPNDAKNVMIEIRAGTGGDEAALFAGELYRMYTRYAESRGWRVEILSTNPTGLGGLQGNHKDDRGERCIQPPQVRGRCSSRAAGSGYRRFGPDSHLRGNGRCAGRSG